MAVPILKQGPFLIASIQAALTDTDVLRLQDDVMAQVGRYRSRGIIVDVTALDVMDSFVSRSLRGIAHMTRLRGAETVIVGHPARGRVRDGPARHEASRTSTPRSTSRRGSRSSSRSPKEPDDGE